MKEKDPYLEELDSSIEGLEDEEVEMPKPPAKPQAQPQAFDKLRPQARPAPKPQAKPQPASASSTNMADNIPLQLVAVIGKKNMVLKDLMKLKVGQVVELDRTPEDAVDVFAGGKLAAKGELVEVEGQLGIRILKMVG